MKVLWITSLTVLGLIAAAILFVLFALFLEAKAYAQDSISPKEQALVQAFLSHNPPLEKDRNALTLYRAKKEAGMSLKDETVKPRSNSPRDERLAKIRAHEIEEWNRGIINIYEAEHGTIMSPQEESEFDRKIEARKAIKQKMNEDLVKYQSEWDSGMHRDSYSYSDDLECIRAKARQELGALGN